MEPDGVIATGRLKEHPLVELVHEVARARLSGAVRLERERVKAVVYFESGEVVFAVTNLRQHRISECALEWRFATATQLASVPKRATEVEFGFALVESGILKTRQLEELVERLTIEVLRHVLLWIDGEWSYDARVRLAQSVRARVVLNSLLVEAVRHLPAEFTAGRIINLKRQVAPVPTAPNALTLSPMESFVLSRIENGMQLDQVVQMTGLPEVDVLRSVYALTLGGFLHGSLWPAALSPAQVSKAEALTAKTNRPGPKVQREISRPFTESTPAAPAPPSPRGAKPTSRESTEATAAADRRGAEAFLLRVEQAQNHYDVLGIGRGSNEDQVKRAYYDLAKRFHPDRFHQDQGTSLHLKLQSAFARVSQAYDNLRDTKLRAAHDRKLEGSAAAAATGTFDPLTADPTAGTPRQQAEVRFQQGLAALQRGNSAGALILCAQAARLAPTEARYRAAYGQALAQDADKRHQAEAELKEAVRLEPKNATFLVVLAEFYSEIGLNRRAITELQRALVIEPGNVMAQRRLSDLQM